MVWNIFKKDEKLIEKFPLRLTPSEKKWVVQQAIEERTSENSIIRKAIKQYQSDIES